MTASAQKVRLEIMLDAAAAAGKLILPMFEAGIASQKKADGSIVTEADTAAEALIIAHLRTVFPDTPVLGEEAVACGQCPPLGRAWFCVDPIDGTRQFASGDPQWTICIGYVEDGVPVAGVLASPAYGRTFAGALGQGAFELDSQGHRHALPRTQQSSEFASMRVLRGGHDSVDAVLALLPQGPDYLIEKRSAALKFGLVAAGEADVFVRAGRVWDWDIVAGAAVLSAAGGQVTDVAGSPLRFGDHAQGFQHPPFFAQGPRFAALSTSGN